MRVLSLFSGGGLGDYGLELAGMEIVGQVEIDDYCQKILKLRWPEVPKWGDIREVRGSEVIERCGRIDLISGGFPCQDISTAGKGIGITGERSGLWKDMLRIIREVRPKYALVENSPVLTSRGLGVVLGDLAESGYDAEWECIPASAIGAPHRRDRIFIVAYSNSIGLEGDRLSKKNCRPLDGGVFTEAPSTSFCSGVWGVSPNSLMGMADGRTYWKQRIKLLGNAQVPWVIKWIGERIMEFENR